MDKLLLIVGPTATGKTALAISLAIKFAGELISADSRQIYRGMDIGTGKDLPTGSPFTIVGDISHTKGTDVTYGYYTVEGVRIWLLDLVNPDQTFSVAHYRWLACQTINSMRSRGVLPIVVGGTGLYIQSILSPIGTIAIPPNAKLRKNLYLLSTAGLGTMLRKEDPERWEGMNRSDRHNPRRLIRAIEVAHYRTNYHNTDKDVNSEALAAYNLLLIGLTAPNKELYRRIDSRIAKRVKTGIQAEISSLVSQGYGWDSPGFTALGYRLWKEYAQGQRTLDATISLWKFKEHGFARRQMTWFKKKGAIHWFSVANPGFRKEAFALVDSWYTNHDKM